MAINTLGSPRRAAPQRQRGRDVQRPRYQSYQRYHRPLPRSPGTWRPRQLPSPMNVAGRKVAGKLAAKVALRFVPFLGTGLLLWDLYQWLTEKGQPGAGGTFDWQNPNVAAHGGLGAFHGFKVFLGPPNPHTHSNLHTTTAILGTVFPAPITTTGTRAVIDWYRCILHPTNVVANQCWIYPAGVTIPNTRAFRLPRIQPGAPLKPWEVPQFEPWLDPAIPHPLHPPVGKGPAPRPYTPGKIGPRIAPGTEPRDIDPGPLVGPQVRNPQPRRRRVRMPKPRLPPWMDPFPQPRVPVPQPVTDPPPVLPGVVTAPIVGPAPAPGFGVAPLPPGAMPDWQWTLPSPQLGRAPRLRPRPPGPGPVRPPPRGTKERKFGMNALGYGWALWLFNFATETRDAVDALVKALPCAVQRDLRRASPVEKMAAIYAHFDDLDVPAALTELFLNHVEDFVIGRAQGAISKGFGSGKSWENYLRSVQASHLFSDQAKAGSKALNRSLDTLAKSLSLPRVQCGRR